MSASSQVPGGELYVYRIDELRQEICRAMAAISENQLHALQESICRQEILCVGLKHLLGRMPDAQLGSAPDARLQQSLQALNQVNRSFGALLSQAQGSNDLLYALCQQYHSARSAEIPQSPHARYSLEA